MEHSELIAAAWRQAKEARRGLHQPQGAVLCLEAVQRALQNLESLLPLCGSTAPLQGLAMYLVGALSSAQARGAEPALARALRMRLAKLTATRQVALPA
ncbi:MAG: hypothetical protein IT463_07820 [Planctomycetes bacterium]|nr:hypothetical protein [Planctomycetota bacterium]